MEIFYRLLGLTSGISHRLSRTRINFVPINLALGVVATFGAFAGFAMVVEALTNSRKPIASTISEVVAGRNPQRYVTLSGELIPKLGLEEVRGRKDSADSRTTARFTLLLDKASGQGILVQTSPEEALGTDPHPFTTIGMVDTPEADVAENILSLGTGAGVKIDNTHLLKLGAEPAPLGVSVALLAVAGLATLLFWITYAKRYVIFRSDTDLTPSMTGASIAPTEATVRVTGQFTLDTGAKQRFLGVRSAPVDLETGDVGFVCNVSASSRFMGVTTTKREGLWIMGVRRDGTVRFTRGRQYLGLSADPALKIEFLDALSGGRQSGILSFDSTAARDAVIAHLTAVGKPMTSAYSPVGGVPYGGAVAPPPSGFGGPPANWHL